ncbi:MAG: hypothetical protein COY80_04950 [Candidatus Pacebacteria bacterium CG_4_10_14_0_8_um_filter_42_14]|nr:MAG: hypothetical protein COY80_04950 [Candidatus Pacebacteria bacterium CG_4_10_14_0_8_um_filter_42_14]
MYTAQLIDDPNDISDLQEEWKILHAKSLTKTVFQAFAFQSVWWETLGVGKRILITVRNEEGKLVALAPTFVHVESGSSQLSLLGCVNVSDYLDVLVDGSESEDTESIYATLLLAVEQIKWTKLFWCSLPEASATRIFMPKHFAANGNINESIQDVVPIINLPSTWEEYLSAVGRKPRHEIRRKERKLEAVSHEYLVLDDPSETDIEDFISLHKQSSHDKNEFWDDNHLMFFRKLIPALAIEKRVKLFFLSVENTRVASMLAFDEPGSLALYNSGFSLGTHDDLSVGSNLIAYTIRYAIEHNKQTYDFLRGDEAYKFRFGAISTNIYDIEITRT